MGSPFTRKTLAFLRALTRNNNREWFKARTTEYEVHVRGPMIELLARLAADFRTFAPELVADPKVSLYRIYRDTRFSDDKTPLKTHAAAHFPHRALGKSGGGGLYLEVAPRWVWIGGGLYMPETQELAAIRAHIDTNHRALRRIVENRTFVKTAGELHGEQLTRVPRGYPKDHPAAHYLRFRQFLAGREYPAEFACDPTFYRELLTVFRQVAPLVRFLTSDPRTTGRSPRRFRPEATGTQALKHALSTPNTQLPTPKETAPDGCFGWELEVGRSSSKRLSFDVV